MHLNTLPQAIHKDQLQSLKSLDSKTIERHFLHWKK